MTRVRARPRRPRPEDPLGRARARLRRRRRAVGVRARHQRRRRVPRRDRASSTASTTPRWATSTARTSSPPACATPARPLAYSFSEADQVKGSWLVELTRQGLRQRQLDRRAGARGGSRGSPASSSELLKDPALADREDDWVQVDADRRAPARARDGAAAAPLPPHAGAAVPAVRRRPEGARPARVGHAATTRIALDFVRHVRGSKATKAETALLQEAVDGCCHDPDQDVLVGASAGPDGPDGGAG